MNIETKNEKTVGYIVMDGNGCMLCTLKGSVKEVLFKFSANIPTKMGRGGPSAERFKRRRVKAREIYLTNVFDIAKHLFITDKSSSISEIVICRTRGYTEDIDKIVLPELAPYVKKVVEITYGGSFGFDQAIRALKAVK